MLNFKMNQIFNFKTLLKIWGRSPPKPSRNLSKLFLDREGVRSKSREYLVRAFEFEFKFTSLVEKTFDIRIIISTEFSAKTIN